MSSFHKAYGSDWGITELRGNSDYVRGSIWSGIFKSYNGETYDASEFYKQKNTNVTLESTIYYSTDKIIFFFPTYFDNGYTSDLFKSEPIISFGMGAYTKMGPYSLEFVAKNLVELGGDTSERPCVDSFDRQYHCGLGIAWSDYGSSKLNHDLGQTLNLVIKYDF